MTEPKEQICHGKYCSCKACGTALSNKIINAFNNRKSEPTHQEWAKRFTIACGYEWHEVVWLDRVEYNFRACSCGHKYQVYDKDHSNPTYLNPADIIREVMKWDNWNEFKNKVLEGNHLRIIDRTNSIYKFITADPPTPLLKAATLFKEGV
jgi:hypothetical protein